MLEKVESMDPWNGGEDIIHGSLEFCRGQDPWILGILERSESIDPWNDGDLRIHGSIWMERSGFMDPWNNG